MPVVPSLLDPEQVKWEQRSTYQAFRNTDMHTIPTLCPQMVKHGPRKCQHSIEHPRKRQNKIFEEIPLQFKLFTT